MRRGIAILSMLVLLVLGVTGLAISKGTVLAGKVVAVSGDKVTVQIEKGNATDAKVGTTVEMELLQGAKAKPSGGVQLQGC